MTRGLGLNDGGKLALGPGQHRQALRLHSLIDDIRLGFWDTPVYPYPRPARLISLMVSSGSRWFEDG